MTQLNHVGRNWVLTGKPSEGAVQREQLFVHNLVVRRNVGQICSLTIAPVFMRLFPARCIDQDSSHRFGRGSKKVPAILPLWLVCRSDQSEIRFVNESGGLKCLTRSFVCHSCFSEFTQFAIDERKQVGRGLPIARFYRNQDMRYVVHDL